MSMEKQKEIKTKDDIVTKASAFVIEYKDVQMFSQNYKLDAHVLGEGMEHFYHSALEALCLAGKIGSSLMISDSVSNLWLL